MQILPTREQEDTHARSHAGTKVSTKRLAFVVTFFHSKGKLIGLDQSNNV